MTHLLSEETVLREQLRRLENERIALYACACSLSQLVLEMARGRAPRLDDLNVGWAKENLRKAEAFSDDTFFTRFERVGS